MFSHPTLCFYHPPGPIFSLQPSSAQHQEPMVQAPKTKVLHALKNEWPKETRSGEGQIVMVVLDPALTCALHLRFSSAAERWRAKYQKSILYIMDST